MAPPLSAELTARMVGNAAVEISDGKSILLTDFPYTSGAYGYLTYPQSELHERTDSICLITHSHADHFDPTLVSKVGCEVLADPTLQSGIAESARLSWDGQKVETREISVEAVPSPHIQGHNSYRVTWQGQTLYFTGDTESTAELLRQERIDWLFISPWLAEKMGTKQLERVARRVVVYHRAEGESADSCVGCLLPEPGDLISLAGATAQGEQP